MRRKRRRRKRRSATTSRCAKRPTESRRPDEQPQGQYIFVPWPRRGCLDARPHYARGPTARVVLQLVEEARRAFCTSKHRVAPSPLSARVTPRTRHAHARGLRASWRSTAQHSIKQRATPSESPKSLSRHPWCAARPAARRRRSVGGRWPRCAIRALLVIRSSCTLRRPPALCTAPQQVHHAFSGTTCCYPAPVPLTWPCPPIAHCGANAGALADDDSGQHCQVRVPPSFFESAG